MNEIIKKLPQRFKVRTKEVNYDKDKNLSQQYGVIGTPTVLFLKNGILMRRHLGEIIPEEFNGIIENIYRL